MAAATDITLVRCPTCTVPVTPAESNGAYCVHCGWKGRALLFQPLAPRVEEAQEAFPDDAVCAHHPSKRAVAVCAGSGDYICSLCAIEIDGKTYSAQYLETVGKSKAGKVFDRYLDRPDRAVVLYMGLCFLPYVNFFWMLGMPVWIPLGYAKLFKANRIRQEDPLFAHVVAPLRLVVLGLLLTFFAAVLILMVVGIAIAIVNAL